MAKEKEKIDVHAAANAVFARKGASQTTLEDVAKEAKVDLKQVKAQYPSVDALVQDVIRRDLEDSTELFIRIINDRGKADIKLTRLVRELLTKYQKSYPLFQIMSVGVEPPTAEDTFVRTKFTQEHMDRYRQNTAILGRLIAQGQSENLFTDVDPLEAASLLRGMIGAALRYRTATNKDSDMRDHADTIMRVFLKGLLR